MRNKDGTVIGGQQRSKMTIPCNKPVCIVWYGGTWHGNMLLSPPSWGLKIAIHSEMWPDTISCFEIELASFVLSSRCYAGSAVAGALLACSEQGYFYHCPLTTHYNSQWDISVGSPRAAGEYCYLNLRRWWHTLALVSHSDFIASGDGRFCYADYFPNCMPPKKAVFQH